MKCSNSLYFWLLIVIIYKKNIVAPSIFVLQVWSYLGDWLCLRISYWCPDVKQNCCKQEKCNFQWIKFGWKHSWSHFSFSFYQPTSWKSTIWKFPCHNDWLYFWNFHDLQFPLSGSPKTYQPSYGKRSRKTRYLCTLTCLINVLHVY